MRQLFAVLSLVVLAGFAVSCHKKTPEEKLQEAAESARQDPYGAIMLAQDILNENTTGPLALKTRWLLFEVYTSDRNFKEARHVLSEIIKQKGLKDPEGQAAARWRIKTYEAAPDQLPFAIEQTTAFLEAITTGTPFWAELKLRQANYLLQDNQITTAQTIIKQVLLNRESPSGAHSDALRQIAVAYGTTETAKSGIEFLQSYLADNPSTEVLPNTHMVLGHLAEVIQDKDLSEKHFQAAFDIYEQRYKEASGGDEKIPILIAHARARSYKGDVDKAAELLRKGVDEFRADANRIDLYYEILRIYAMNLQHEKAIEVAREIQKEFLNEPRRADSYLVAADQMLRLKRYDEAVSEYKEVMKLFPGTQYAQMAARSLQGVEYLRIQDSKATDTLAIEATTAPLTQTTPGAAETTQPATTAVSTTPTQSNEPSSPTSAAQEK